MQEKIIYLSKQQLKTYAFCSHAFLSWSILQRGSLFEFFSNLSLARNETWMRCWLPGQINRFALISVFQRLFANWIIEYLLFRDDLFWRAYCSGNSLHMLTWNIPQTAWFKARRKLVPFTFLWEPLRHVMLL